MISPAQVPEGAPPPSDPILDPLLDPLNGPQRAAVTHGKGPLLVIAGAGSGKTRVITHRIAHLIRGGTPPDSILAITFTNKAAAEMQRRVEALMGVRSRWISTFHSFAARILRRHLYRIPPYSSAFTIYDQDDVQGLLKEILKEMRLESKQWSPRAFAGDISRAKNRGIGDPDQFPVRNRYRDQVLQKVFTRYQRALGERNAVDFDDLLLLLVRLFTEHPDLLQRYREQFRHVLIDEYQDTNLVQYRIGRLLTEESRNLCVTGDPDQAIYSWRGADMENLRRFEADYPEARSVTLDQNYRSTRRILRAANAVIRHDRDRKPKDLWSENPEGEAVRVRRFEDGAEEANAVAAGIRKLRESGVPGGGIAVFYRVNSLSREVEQALIYAGIPYVVVGGVEFFQRREVKDVLAYLRLLQNPRDTESLRRIINLPPRRIGPAALERAAEEARAAGVSLLQVVLDPGRRAALGVSAGRALEGFASVYLDLAALPRDPVAPLVEEVVRRIGFLKHLRESEGDEADERIRNVEELVNAAAEFDAGRASEGAPPGAGGNGDEDGPRGGLEAFLAEVALLSAVDRWREREDQVSLMSLHSAKGLEFPAVFIVGLESGILPLVRSSADPDEEGLTDIPEERRLLYVGITRARERLVVSHVRERMRFGRLYPSVPSEFLGELVDADSEPGLDLDRGTRDCLRGPAESAIERDGETAAAQEDWAEGCDEDPFPAGTRVLHAVYGEGTVVRAWGAGARRRVTVRFDRAGEKQLVLGFAKLVRI